MTRKLKIGESMVDVDGTRTKVPVIIEGERGAEHVKWMRVKPGTKIRRGQEVAVEGKSAGHKPVRWV